jgi:endo-1,4-beta-xylanase
MVSISDLLTNKENMIPVRILLESFNKTLIVAALFLFLNPSYLYAQTILLDDFEDGDLVAENYCYWGANAWAQAVNGEVLDLENADDGTANRAVHATIQTGTGTWATADVVLTLDWDLGNYAYKTYVDYGYDLRAFKQIRFRAKASPGVNGRFNQVSGIIPNYQYYYKSITLSENWTQFTIDFSQLTSDQSTVTLQQSLEHTYDLGFAVYPGPDTTVDIWIDDLELVTDPNYESPVTPVIPSGLKEAAESEGLNIGFLLQAWTMSNESLKTFAENNAQFIMSGWQTCQAVIQRFPHYWDYAQADSVIKWAYDNNKKVKLQHLVWHGSTPDWIVNAGYAPAEVNDIMKQFIQQSIEHYNTNYPNTVTHYSVVNEAVNDSNGSYRETFWYNELGPEYIANAFRFAHEADPNAKLYYNDYNIDGINTKSNAVYNMVSDLLDDGVPIHGIGLQMHIFNLNQYPGKQSILNNMSRFGQLGLEVYVTEADVVINADQTGLTEEKLSEQATIYREILEACLESPYCNDFALWGITDRYSWIINHTGHDDWPLLLDENFQPKPAWCAIMEELIGAGDLNADCRVNILDVAIFSSQWLDIGDCSANGDCADLNADNQINFQDFSVIGQNY